MLLVDMISFPWKVCGWVLNGMIPTEANTMDAPKMEDNTSQLSKLITLFL
jgi:hypothetical protein